MAKKRKRSSSITQRLKKSTRTGTQPVHDASGSAADCPSTPSSNLPIPDVQSHNMESYLVSIPTELLEGVADHLDTTDLVNVRLTCKDIGKRVDHVFATKCFSERSFLLSDQSSLVALLEISMHQKYSKSMRRIRFCPAPLRPLPVESEPIEDRGERGIRRDFKTPPRTASARGGGTLP
jgi:hypothetical protein